MYKVVLNKYIGFGNNVSHSERKTRRKFESNRQKIKLYSRLLNCYIEVNGSVKNIRTIYKYGCIDIYLKHCKNIDSKFKYLRSIIKTKYFKHNNGNTDQLY